MSHSKFVAYFDESGDHGLDKIDPIYPIFILCGVVFEISDYLARDLPKFTKLKFDYFGHDYVIFHSRSIRKQLGPFQILSNSALRNSFLNDVSAFYSASSGTLIAAGIDKRRLKKQYVDPDDPYDISLLFCLERLFAFLNDQRAARQGTLTCIFEKRGEVEDKQLSSHFLRICAGENRWGKLPFNAVFADKKTNFIRASVPFGIKTLRCCC
jgi:uncharacterized protein DUF3800